MQSELLFFRLIALGVFIAALYAGYYMLKNYQKLFGIDPDMPSEGASSRAYFQVQVFVVWAHIVVGSGACALLAR